MTHLDPNEPTLKIDGPVKPRIPDIDIEAKIGEGGMGMVFRGRQPYLDRLVAVKVLPATLTQNQQFVERFQREAKILAGLNHPNIVGCYSAGQTDKKECYLAMEFIDGPNLRQWIGKNGRMDELHVLQVGRALLQALQYAHERDIIHRDVKPENVLLQQLTGKEATDAAFPYKVKLVDLGLARPSSKDTAETKDMALTVQGTILGTPATMAPEQFDDPDNVDHKADIYGLGCVLYHMLAGQPAFPEQQITAIIKRKSTGEVPSPSDKVPGLSPAVSKLVTDMLQPRRDDRPEYKDLLTRCEALLLKGATSELLPSMPDISATNLNPGARTQAGGSGILIESGGSRVSISGAGVQISQVGANAPAPTGSKLPLILGVVAVVAIVAVAAVMMVRNNTADAPPTTGQKPPPAQPLPQPTPPAVQPTPTPTPTPPAQPQPTLPAQPTPPAAPDYTQVAVEAAQPEAPLTFDINGRNFLNPDSPTTGWTSEPKNAFQIDEDFAGGALVGHDISRAFQPIGATPAKLEGTIALYTSVGAKLEPRANQAGVAVVFEDGRCLSLALSTLGTSTLATVERWDAGLPGVVPGDQPVVKKAAKKTDSFPGVLTMPQTETVHWTIQIQNNTVYFEANDKPLAQAVKLPGKPVSLALWVNGTPTQTASFRQIRVYPLKK